jgi:Asp-tRNA(Asn)/Glu-tRNA(Gln) amidotransferase A subunit family amidase
VTVPAGLSDNHLPLGLQCVARFGDDELLLTWAKDIAKVFNVLEGDEGTTKAPP